MTTPSRSASRATIVAAAAASAVACPFLPNRRVWLLKTEPNVMVAPSNTFCTRLLSAERISTRLCRYGTTSANSRWS